MTSFIHEFIKFFKGLFDYKFTWPRTTLFLVAYVFPVGIYFLMTKVFDIEFFQELTGSLVYWYFFTVLLPTLLCMKTDIKIDNMKIATDKEIATMKSDIKALQDGTS